MHLWETLKSGKPWREYARKVPLRGLLLDLVPLEERHRRQVEQFQDRLDYETVYLRYGAWFSAETRKSTAWLEKQWNNDIQQGFYQGAFLDGCLIAMASIFGVPGGRSAEAALVVAPDFQGLGRGGEKGVGALLGEDLIRYARDQQFEWVSAHLAVRNPRCETLLREFGFEVSSWSHLNQEGSATLDLRSVAQSSYRRLLQ